MGGASNAGGSTGDAGPATGCELRAGDVILFDFNAATSVPAEIQTSGPATVALDTEAGSPLAASLAVTIPFGQTSGAVNAGVYSAITPDLNLNGKTLFACLRWDSGTLGKTTTGTDACLNVQFVLNSSHDDVEPLSRSYSWSVAKLCTKDQGSWTELSLPVKSVFYDGALTFDTSMINRVAISVSDKDTNFNPAAGQVVAPTSATVHIDTIGYR